MKVADIVETALEYRKVDSELKHARLLLEERKKDLAHAEQRVEQLESIQAGLHTRLEDLSRAAALARLGHNNEVSPECQEPITETSES